MSVRAAVFVAVLVAGPAGAVPLTYAIDVPFRPISVSGRITVDGPGAVAPADVAAWRLVLSNVAGEEMAIDDATGTLDFGGAALTAGPDALAVSLETGEALRFSGPGPAFVTFGHAFYAVGDGRFSSGFSRGPGPGPGEIVLDFPRIETTPVPAPAALPLSLSALAALGWAARRARRPQVRRR